MTLHSGTVNFDFPKIFRGPKISSFWSQNREKVEIEKSIKMRFFWIQNWDLKIEIEKSICWTEKSSIFDIFFKRWTEFWQNDEKSSPARSIFWKFQSSSQKSGKFSPANEKISWEVQNPMRGKIDLVFAVTSKGWDQFFENVKCPKNWT